MDLLKFHLFLIDKVTYKFSSPQTYFSNFNTSSYLTLILTDNPNSIPLPLCKNSFPIDLK